MNKKQTDSIIILLRLIQQPSHDHLQVTKWFEQQTDFVNNIMLCSATYILLGRKGEK